MSPAAILVLFLCGLGLASFAEEEGTRQLLLVGGALADDNEEIYGRFVNMSGGAGTARIGIVTAASSDPQGSAEFYEEIFALYGASETYWIDVYEGNLGPTVDPDVIEKVSTLTGVFFGGGDQRRIVNCLYLQDDGHRVETPLMTELRRIYEIGSAAMGGTSAGAAVMSGGVMVTGGVSYDALARGSRPDGEPGSHPDDLTYDPEGGLGFMPAMVVDTHFSQRGREGRLIRLLSDTAETELLGTSTGFGVGENTAMAVVTDVDGGTVLGEVIGEAGVFLVDVGFSHAGEVNGEWAVDTVYAYYLTAGDSIRLDDWTQITYADYKTDLEGNETNDEAETSDDIFMGDGGFDFLVPELTKIATGLFDSRATSTHGDTKEQHPEFRVRFGKGDYSAAYGGDDPDTGKRVVSYQDMLIDIWATQ